VALALLALCGGCDRESGELVPLDFEATPLKPKTVKLMLRDVCPSMDGYRIADVFVVQSSLRLEEGKVRIDFDRDGLSNNRESELAKSMNTSFQSADSNGDGYTDLVVATAGFSRDEQQSLAGCASVAQDTDLDGLTDCEENNVLHTNPSDPDSDNDGLLDGLEVRAGLNPTDGSDGTQDADNDGTINYDEVKANTPVSESTTETVRLHALAYKSTSKLIEGKECLDLEVSNIPLLQVGNGNLLRFFVLERRPPTQEGEETSDRATFTYKNISYTTNDSLMEINYEDLDRTSN
jgi:hypothetical protein